MSDDPLGRVRVAIAGNIGSGKSSLTALLSQKFGWKPFYEVVDTNPYLTDFYKDMNRWSFQLQMFFLTTRFESHIQLAESQTSIVQDRTIYEDAEIFARHLFLSGKMEERDYRTYLNHYELLVRQLKPPHLLIYLKSDVQTLMRRIAKRGRDYEKTIPEEYLEALNKQYEAWISSYKRSPVVVVDVTRQDFVNVPKHLEQVASVAAWELQCLRNKAQGSLPLPKPAARSLTI